MENKLFRKGNRFRYDLAIKYYKLEALYAGFLQSQLVANRKRLKGVYSEKRLMKMFFNLPVNRWIQFENTIFDKEAFPDEPLFGIDL